MKQTGKLLLASFLAVMLVLPLVAAQSILENLGKYLFGFSGIGQTNTIVVQLMIWLILFFAFADIISIVFSKPANWLIGFGLAVIAANVGWVSQMNEGLFGVTAGLGSFSVAAVIGITFVAFLLAHFGLSWAVDWIQRAKTVRAIRQGRMSAKEGLKTLKEIGKETGR